jgi:hypothetical protein
MNRIGTRAVTAAELLSLVYELLDAHADTVEIGAELSQGLRWRVHVDYLRALQRNASEILARWHPPTETIAPK